MKSKLIDSGVLTLRSPMLVTWREDIGEDKDGHAMYEDRRLMATAIGCIRTYATTADSVPGAELRDVREQHRSQPKPKQAWPLLERETDDDAVDPVVGVFIEPYHFYDATGESRGMDCDHAVVFVPFSNIAGIQYDW